MANGNRKLRPNWISGKQWLLALMLLVEFISAIQGGVLNINMSKKYDVDNEFAIGKCRQRCFLKTLTKFQFRHAINSEESISSCRQQPSCFMCYDYCQVLTVATSDLAISMCSDTVYCTKGCRIACDFHKIKSFETLRYELINNA